MLYQYNISIFVYKGFVFHYNNKKSNYNNNICWGNALVC
ncbi:hypothetical protein CCYN49044_180171 [Capnocytophaga cynodegmi]|uniref:Uncharacterized protein n=1 Tax=Capnocytophaga cynodegmi TaxID=28189 RepID=A0A0B7H8V7_9FLAO|nr:hypothetical protein CCYN74_140005 [Capnocytophaga cynodegmi]CEN36718.1 hypothetical protein CCYN49044_180171 [Capnocytophaga cynodegmi]